MKNQNEENKEAYVAPAVEAVISEEVMKREVHYAGGGLTDLPPPPP